MSRPTRLLVALAFCLACVTSIAAELKPFQQEALDRVLATTDPEAREMMRAQLEPMLAFMDEAQVRLFMASYEGSGESEQVDDTEAPREATPEDLAANQQQWEPAVRSAWQAQKSFDDYVEARLSQACGDDRGAYAVFGAGWRYEVYPLQPNWPRASNSPDLDVQIIGPSYAPQDGRYRFDFSQVRQDFDRGAVDAAIDSACADYRRIGEEFLATAKPRIVDGYLPGGMELEGAANAEVSPVRARLEEALKAQSPAGDGALYQALLNAERID